MREGEGKEGGRASRGEKESILTIFRLDSLIRQLLPSEEIFEDYLHPMLFWGIFF
jgi:hypothetical protein